MELADASEFIRTHHHAVLATRRADGSPQLSPVAAATDGEGRVLISTRETAVKTKNLLRNPLASLCVISDGFFGEWVQVNGSAEIVTRPDAMDLLVDTYRQIAGEHDDWDDFKAAMVREKRVIIRIAIDSAGPDQRG